MCLDEVGLLDYKEEIKKWVLAAETSNHRWGQIPKSNEETVIRLFQAYLRATKMPPI